MEPLEGGVSQRLDVGCPGYGWQNLVMAVKVKGEVKHSLPKHDGTKEIIT